MHTHNVLTHPIAPGFTELSERPASSNRPGPSTRNGKAAPPTTTPVCHFFALNGSCRNGDSCAFSHNVTPGDTRSVVCSFFRKGSCRYGDSCRFRHDDGLENAASFLDDDSPAVPSATAAAAGGVCQSCNDDSATQQDDNDDDDDDELICGICMEHPTKFGLLSGCDHVFCFECLMEWRSSSSSSSSGGGGEHHLNNTMEQKSLVKVCPVCRTHSDYVLSSFSHAKTGNGKEDLMMAHKLRLSQISCKRFTIGDLGSCPFGRDCFYKHLDEYGDDIKHLDQSKQDIQEELERRKRRRQRHLASQNDIDAELEILQAQLHLLRLGLASFAFQLDI